MNTITKIMFLLTVVAGLFLLCGTAQAEFMKPVAASAEQATWPIARTLQPDLTEESPAGLHPFNTSNAISWLASCNWTTNQTRWVRYQLGADLGGGNYEKFWVSKIYLWQYSYATQTYRQLKDFDIYASDDGGVTYTQVGGTCSMTLHTSGSIPATSFEVGAFATHIQMIVKSNQSTTPDIAGHKYVGFAEFRFEKTRSSAWNPDPDDGDTGVALDATLSWNTALNIDGTDTEPNVTGHHLWMSDAGNPNLSYVTTIPASGTSASYGPLSLSRDEVYYWGVDEGLFNEPYNGDPNSLIAGTVWMFETVPSLPVIVAQPLPTLAPVGDTAVFTIGAENPFTGDYTGLNYQWYKYVDGGSDTTVGVDSNTLTITTVQLSDGGDYYCIASLTAIPSNTATSDMAELRVGELMGHWKFNGDMTDSSGNGWDGSSAAPVSYYDPGIDANSVEFLAIDLNPVYITGSESAFNICDMGMTVSTWMKSGFDSGAIIELVSKENISNHIGWEIYINTAGESALVFVGEGGRVYSDTYVLDNEWHMVTFTYDGTTGYMAMYIDANREGTSTGAPIGESSTRVYIGSGQNASGVAFRPYEGLLDDVRIYNYPLEGTEVVDLYNDFIEPDVNRCALEYASNLDISGPEGVPDCKVSLYDFAEMASGWLTCGLYPNCP